MCSKMETTHKRKGQLVGLIICSVLLTAMRPYIPQKTLKEKKLKGPVRMVIEKVDHYNYPTVVVHVYDTLGRLESIRYFKEEIDDDYSTHSIPDTTNTKLSFFVTYRYNEKSKILEEKSINPDGKVANEIRYIYDEKDSLVRVVFYSFNDSGATRDSSILEYTYWSGDWNLTQSVYGHDTHRFYTQYDEKNMARKEMTWDSRDSDRIILTEYEYNDIGKVIRERRSSEDTMIKKINFKTDIYYVYEDTLLVRVKSIDSNYIIQSIETSESVFSYMHGKLVQEKHFRKSIFQSETDSSSLFYAFNEFGDQTYATEPVNGIGINRSWEYEYDSHGNWIKRWLTQDKEVDIKSRIIVYY